MVTDSTPIEDERAAGVVPRGREKSADAPAASESRPRLLRRVLAELSTDALFDLADEAAREGLSLAEYVNRRCDEAILKLIRDAAPVALRELRRVRG